MSERSEDNSIVTKPIIGFTHLAFRRGTRNHPKIMDGCEKEGHLANREIYSARQMLCCCMHRPEHDLSDFCLQAGSGRMAVAFLQRGAMREALLLHLHSPLKSLAPLWPPG